MKHLTLFLILICVNHGVIADVNTLLQLADYMGVDYAEAVDNGNVINAFEYAEMEEFSRRIHSEIEQLKIKPVSSELVELSDELITGVSNLVEPAVIVITTQKIRHLVMASYDVVMTPRQKPDLQAAALLYETHCASCHGATGFGDGIAAQGLDPAPTDFHDINRAKQRSVFGLYNTITLGVDGTTMIGRPDLHDLERWSLAFYVGGIINDISDIEKGSVDLQNDPLSLHDAVTMTPAELDSVRAEGESIAFWVRKNPDVLFDSIVGPLDIAEQNLSKSLQSYIDGDIAEAQEFAVTAYLEGFELIEAALSNLDRPLLQETEQSMMAFRNAISQDVDVEQLQKNYQQTLSLLDKTRIVLSERSLSPSMAFSGSSIILLREGLEVILVLAAMIAFVIKSNRTDALKYIHAGWIVALIAGIATWAFSSFLVTISGATREITEGATALLAAVILLYVGFWMHRNANARRWNQFLQGKMKSALDTRTLWTLALISFLAVYREVFETILFYQALWAQVSVEAHSAVFYGVLVAALILAFATWSMTRFGMRLPLKQFFTISAVLMIALAFIFTGKGITALQEAGKIPSSPIDIPKIELLGIYPNMQALMSQILVILVTAGVLIRDNLTNNSQIKDK